MPRRVRLESSRDRLPDPGSRFTKATPLRAKSAISRTAFGLPLATTMPSSHTAKANTTAVPLGNSLRTWGRLDSPVASSRKCEPALGTNPFPSNSSACELWRCALKTQKFFKGDLEHWGQLQRNQRLGNVAPGLHRVDRLPADTDLACEGGGRKAAFLTDLTQQVFNIHTVSLGLCHFAMKN